MYLEFIQSTGRNPIVQLRPQQQSGYHKLFKFYGIDLIKADQQLVGDCPFCQKESHFFANPGTGLWDCKRCGVQGNHYDFIRQFHEHCLSSTTTDDYKALAEVRSGISPETFRFHKLAYNFLLDEWLLPSWNLKGNISNLYAWKQQSTLNGPVMTVMSGPVFKQIMYGLQHYRKDRSRPLWVLEGHWDLLAFFEALLMQEKLNEHDFIAVPGATTFPEEDVPLLSMRDIRLCYDHDKAGEQGIYKAVQKLGRYNITPSSIQRVVWDKQDPEGYDLRDFKTSLDSPNGLVQTRSNGSVQPSPQKGLTYKPGSPPFTKHSNDTAHSQRVDFVNALEAKLQTLNVDLKKAANENYNPSAKMIPCENFEDLCDSIATKLEMPDCLRDLFAILTSVACTTNVFEKPIWMYLVGEPGTGKTTQVELFNTASDYCFGISKMTGLLSGYFKEGMGDASLLQHFQDKCVIIKDFTTILNMAPQIQDNIFGELRDMYDGSTAAYYRNHVKRIFKGIRFNMIACVTNKIRAINNTDVGERFLCCEYDSYWGNDGRLITDSIDNSKMTRRATTNVLMKIGKRDNSDSLVSEQRGQVWGYLNHVVERIKHDEKWVQHKVQTVLEDEDTLSYIENLARWTASARSGVMRDKDKQITYRPKIESEKRLAEQLTKQAIGISLTLDEEPNSERVRSCVRKLAMDTGYGFQQEIMLAICHNKNRQARIDELARELNLGQTSILKYLRDMQELGIVKHHTPAIAIRGNQPHIYALAPRMEEIASALGYFTPLQN